MLALAAPTLGVGLVAIAGFAATAVGKFYVLDPAIQRRFPVGEPWVILFYALFGSVLLAFRLRDVALERETLRLQAESAATEQLARAFLHLRDYANTPIQTIVFTVELVRVRHPELDPDYARLQRAVERLMVLSRALNRYESAHQWRAGDNRWMQRHWPDSCLAVNSGNDKRSEGNRHGSES